MIYIYIYIYIITGLHHGALYYELEKYISILKLAINLIYIIIIMV